MYLFDHISEANANNNCMIWEQTLLCRKEAEQGRNFGAKYWIIFEIIVFVAPRRSKEIALILRQEKSVNLTSESFLELGRL